MLGNVSVTICLTAVFCGRMGDEVKEAVPAVRDEVKEAAPAASEAKPTPEKAENDGPKNKKTWEKKPRYNGAWKKRKWAFDRRDDTDEKRVRSNPEERVKKRKYCMLLAFAGAKFLGMQRNPGVNTIEEELLKALLKNKMINDEGFNQPQMIHFQRAARTDKGVSAVRQCCSLKLRELNRGTRVFSSLIEFPFHFS